MTRAGTVVVVAAAALGAACMGHRGQAGTQPQAQAQAEMQPPATGGRGMGTMQDCPMAVPGTQVSAADTEDGEAITFTTSSPDQVQALRDRVHAMADMHERHMQAHAGMPGGMDGDAQGGAMQGDMGGTGAEGSAGSGDGSKQPGEAQGEGMGAGPGMMGMHHRMPPSRATVEDVDGGARVTVAAQDPADADQLRSAIRMHVDHMQQTGSCGMGGMPPQQQPSQQR